MIKFNYNPPIDTAEAAKILTKIETNPLGGWFNLDSFINQPILHRIKAAAGRIQTESNYLICIGVGGSYLGHRAIIEALGANDGITKVLYAGNSFSGSNIQAIIDEVGDSDFSILVISKSGHTLEPALAYRIFKRRLIDKYGPSRYRSRIFITTDAKEGSLLKEAEREEYEHFVVPDNLGGRFSVLSAVGLLPLAVAGVDIDALLSGAREQQDEITRLRENPADLSSSAALRYAYSRHAFRSEGADTEVLATFNENLHYFAEWWKQLFGESEGKTSTAIFPASVTYSADLHSMGQYMQQGRRNIFETIIKITTPKEDFKVPPFVDNTDGLKYLEGKTLSYIESQALAATIYAHRDGGIPVLELDIPAITEKTLGALIYFFELACAVSAMLAGVDPFDQPGVDAYKYKMYHLLGRQ